MGGGVGLSRTVGRTSTTSRLLLYSFIFFLVQKVHLGRRFSFCFFLPFSGLVMNGKYWQANGTTAYWSHYNKRGEPERAILSDGRRLLNGKGEKFQFSRPAS